MKNLDTLLFIGRDSGTSRHRAQAFARIGFDVTVIDPFSFLPKSNFMARWTWHTGCLFLEDYISRNVLAAIPNRLFGWVYVDGGELLGPRLVQELKSRFGKIVNYNIDDPFSRRDGRRFRLYLQALPIYDLVVVLRDCNISEAYSQGAQRVMRVTMSADEVAHAPSNASAARVVEWQSEVLFIGTWMAERGPFLARLLELGVPLSIYGLRWQKAPEWDRLQRAWRGPGLYADEDYAAAIRGAKVNLGLLSKGNRDQSTTRSFEIPALEGVLCAERTDEHMRLYQEQVEAVFWSAPEECAAKCFMLLGDDRLRENMRTRGRRRCLGNGTMNEAVLLQIAEQIGWQLPRREQHYAVSA
jgi:spore maturation protein CgeB